MPHHGNALFVALLAVVVLAATAVSSTTTGGVALRSQRLSNAASTSSTGGSSASSSSGGSGEWNGPQDQCGWPAVYPGGLFRPATVRLLQHLLAHALARNVTVTGVLDAATERAIKEFQTKAGLPHDGFVGPMTWPKLTATATPLLAGSKGAAVLGLQDALTFAGFETPMTGVFDTATTASLAAFNAAHGNTHNSTTTAQVNADTWHLLATLCNGTGVFWFDAGWPQGRMNEETLRCLRFRGFRYATFECWVEVGQGQFWSECAGNIKRAWEAQFEAVGVYMFAQRFADPSAQVMQLLGNLSQQAVRFTNVMLDIEGDKWAKYTHEENRVFITALRKGLEAAGVNVTIYCGREWPNFFGSNFTDFSDLPVFYAHYDNIPSYVDFSPYGGWTRPSGKQFWDGSNGEQICQTGGLDWDWSEKPFWST